MSSDEYLASLESRLTTLTKRVAELEGGQTKIEKQMLEIALDLKYLKASQDSLNSNLTKFLWIVGGGFIAALVGFIVRGGLSQ